MSAQSTHDRILQEGLALMSRDGLSGVTLGVLATQVGMSKSGLFAHFGSKEDVQIELIRHMARFAAKHIMEPLAATESGLPRLRAVIDAWFGWAQRAGLPGGCPATAALFEIDDVDGPVRDELLLVESEWHKFLVELATQAVQNGEFRPDLDTEQFVWELHGIYLSHHVSQRFLRSPDADSRARIARDALIERATSRP